MVFPKLLRALLASEQLLKRRVDDESSENDLEKDEDEGLAAPGRRSVSIVGQNEGRRDARRVRPWRARS